MAAVGYEVSYKAYICGTMIYKSIRQFSNQASAEAFRQKLMEAGTYQGKEIRDISEVVEAGSADLEDGE